MAINVGVNSLVEGEKIVRIGKFGNVVFFWFNFILDIFISIIYDFKYIRRYLVCRDESLSYIGRRYLNLTFLKYEFLRMLVI